MTQGKNQNKNQSYKLLLIVLLILIIYLLYDNQKENFTDLNKLFNKSNNLQKFNLDNHEYGYNGINDHSGSRYSVTDNKLNELKKILDEIVEGINRKTDSNFYLGNIDNITKSLDNENRFNYLVDAFLFEKDKDYTLKVIFEFLIKKNGKVQVKNITRSNAFKYDSNNSKFEDHPQVFNYKLSEPKNFEEKYNISGIMKTDLESSVLKDNINKEIPTPAEFDKDILPLAVQEDNYYKSEQNRKFIIDNVVNEKNNKMRCWNKDGIRNSNPKHSNCVVFKREKEVLLDGNICFKSYIKQFFFPNDAILSIPSSFLIGSS